MIAKQISQSKWVYFLDKSKPHPRDPNIFLVMIAVKGEPEMAPALFQDKEWWLNDQNIEHLNFQRGYSPSDVDSIVASCRK